jgi:hypothetical protein
MRWMNWRNGSFRKFTRGLETNRWDYPIRLQLTGFPMPHATAHHVAPPEG